MKKLSITYGAVFTFLKWYCLALLAYTFFMPNVLLQCLLLGAAVYFDLFASWLKGEEL